MPSSSKSQQRFFGLVHAVQKGDMKAPSEDISEAAKSMKKKDVKDFASTKTKDLPEKKRSKKQAAFMRGMISGLRVKRAADMEHTESASEEANEIEGKGELSSEAEKAIRDYVIKTPNLDDSKFHAYVESLNIDPHEAEEAVYRLVREFAGNETPADNGDLLPGGKAEGKSVSEFNPNEISKGKKVEKEHTPSTAVAQEISKDHLEEIPDYYTRLKIMEDDAKKDIKKDAALSHFGKGFASICKQAGLDKTATATLAKGLGHLDKSLFDAVVEALDE